MRNRDVFLLSAWLIAVLAVVAVTVGMALPPDMRLPMHWNAVGEVDRWGGKWLALLMPVGLAVVTTSLFAGMTRVRSAHDAMARSAGLINVGVFGMIGLAWTIELMVIAVGFQWQVAPLRFLFIGMGLLFVFMGNQFGKSRPMRFVGIRTPWTLADPDVWIATHRLGGKLFVVAGLVWVAAGLIGLHGPHAMRILLAVMLAAALLPAAWSYILWRRIARR
jgi:uncharacterized membrane protein